MSSSGNFSTGILANTGIAMAWGLNNLGQLGTNNFTSYSSPVTVVGNHSFTEITQGFNFCISLKGESGEAWAWGTGSNGRLGNNETNGYSSPIKVVGGHVFKNVSAGNLNAFGLKGDGSLWSWGGNASGELGDGTTTDRSSPVAVIGSHSFKTISFGYLCSIALKGDGSAWAWGNNVAGQCGNNASGNSYSSPVAVIGNHSFIKVKISGVSSVGLKADGSVWCWGDNAIGQCGNNTSGNSYSSPVAVVGSHSFIEVMIGGGTAVAAATNALALKADGSVWSWGGNGLGQLGDNSTTNRSSPVQVVGSHSFNHLVAGTSANGAIKANGEIWEWGSNLGGRLGDNSRTNRSSPVLVIGGFYYVSPWETTLLRQWVNLNQASWHAAARAFININSTSWARIIDTEVQVGGAWKMSY